MPKTPDQLREQAEKQNAEHPPAAGKSRTAEGLEIPNPSRKQFFADLDKVSEELAELASGDGRLARSDHDE